MRYAHPSALGDPSAAFATSHSGFPTRLISSTLGGTHSSSFESRMRLFAKYRTRSLAHCSKPVSLMTWLYDSHSS